ncbi:hypothetical protein DUNSADRAFT_14969 [Dunaliella salina]|uniref:Encoded protein n=1 Tax=Dunaliella salina TaxID=3046 RepID=A0ABQ7H275_DUNSA|nr:hypothetical protein DUNSADRAFT_14969 [Dunaliella salina]|eukprot:KAF5840946.1 hypothetical protein DUNSADRAFT_14969 [Dunaliella salina]
MSQTTGGKGLPQQSHSTTPVSPVTSGAQHTAQGVDWMGSSTAKLPVHAASNSRLAASQPLAATQEDTWSNSSKIRRRGDVSQLQVHGVRNSGVFRCVP